MYFVVETVAFLLDLFDFETLPARYDSSEHWHCRAYRTVFNQGECGACLSFAVATAYGMNRCAMGEDVLPSPYRIFDCSGSKCDEGTTFFTANRVMQAGVPDLNASAPVYGMGCEEGPYKATMQVYLGKQSIKRALMRGGALVHTIDLPTIMESNFMGDFEPGASEAGHAVVVIGWGSEPKPHWIIHNSWSENWGWKGRGILQMYDAEIMVGFRSNQIFSWPTL